MTRPQQREMRKVFQQTKQAVLKQVSQ